MDFLSSLRDYDKSSISLIRMREKILIAEGFEPSLFRTGALNQRLRPLGHATLHNPIEINDIQATFEVSFKTLPRFIWRK